MNDIEAHELVIVTACSAQVAQRNLAKTSCAAKDAVLEAMIHSLIEYDEAILTANTVDLERGRQGEMKSGLLNRLALDSRWLSAIAGSLREVAALSDPVDQVIDGSVMPNGLRVRRVQVPLGVVGMVYEACPDVTADTAALAIGSGNAIILREDNVAQDSNAVVVVALYSALEAQGLPIDLVTSVDAGGRDGVHALIYVHGLVDALVPRGGAGFTHIVIRRSTVPAIEAGPGDRYVYVDASTDLEVAVDIIVNAKTQRVGVCGAAEALLIHVDVTATYLSVTARALWDKDTILHADPTTRRILTEAVATAGRNVLLTQVTEADWDTGHDSLGLTVRVAKSLEEAIDHIRTHTTRHTRVVLAQDVSVINGFIADIDSVAVMVSVPTRFTDDRQLGLGAELGIFTQKPHARGLVGLSELTTTTWIVEGDGHIRPRSLVPASDAGRRGIVLIVINP